MIQLLPGIRIKEPFRHSTYGRVKVKTIPLGSAAWLVQELFLGKHILSKAKKVTGNMLLPCYLFARFLGF